MGLETFPPLLSKPCEDARKRYGPICFTEQGLGKGIVATPTSWVLGLRRHTVLALQGTEVVGAGKTTTTALCGKRRISTPCRSESKMSLSFPVWSETITTNFLQQNDPPITRLTCSAPDFKRYLVI